MDFLAELVCDEDFIPAVCEDVIFLLMGFDKAQFNETLLDTIVHHSPAGTSARAIVHYAQEVNSGIILHIFEMLSLNPSKHSTGVVLIKT